jgi:hypothetical protein
MPCGCCGAAGPSSAHHPRTDQGASQRADDWLAIPLCWDCHQGPKGVHGDKTYLRIFKLTELEILARTLKTLYGRLH